MSSSDRLDDLYGQLPNAQSPADIDDAIRAAARDAAAREAAPRWSRPWSVGLATAAALVLAVGITLRLPDSARDVSPGPSHDVAAPTPSAGREVEVTEAAQVSAFAAPDAGPPNGQITFDAATTELADSATARSPAAALPERSALAQRPEAPVSTESLTAPPEAEAIDAYNADTRSEVGDAASEELARGAAAPVAAPAAVPEPLVPPRPILQSTPSTGEPAAADPEIAADAPDAPESRRRSGLFGRLMSSRRKAGVQTVADPAGSELPLDCEPGQPPVRAICTFALPDMGSRAVDTRAAGDYRVGTEGAPDAGFKPAPRADGRRQGYRVVPVDGLDCDDPYEFEGPATIRFESTLGEETDRAATDALPILRWRQDGAIVALSCAGGDWLLDAGPALP
ncbi:MAG: hypothetical protein AAF515_22170 [Pseudomonadota bacterium]